MQVGEDILNVCSKCGDVKHVVVAIVGSEVAQVECKECGARHRYRAPTGDAAAPVKKKKKATRRSATKAPAGPLVEPDLDRPVRAYQTSDTYTVGDRVDHSHFGTGVVEEVVGPTKMRVFFSDGQKTLLQGRD